MPDGPRGFQEYLESYNVSAGAQQRQTITVTDLISEGPIEGLVDGQASIYLNDDRAAPLSQATTPASLSKASISLTNNSATATISDGTIVLADNGKKYLIVKKGQGSIDVTATDAGAASDNGVIHCTLTAGSSFFTTAMVSSPSNISSYVPCRLVTTDDNDGESNEGYGEGSISKRTSGTVVTFIAGEGNGGTWKPSGTYNLEVDKVVEISSISGSTVTLASAWAGTTGSYKYDVTGTIVDTTDTVAQTQIANYEALTTQFRVGTKSQAPFVDTGGHGSTSISNSPSAGGTIEQTSGYGSGSQAAKELLGGSSAGFNLSAAQLQEVDEARVTWAYAGGHYAVSGKGNNQPTFTQYSITFQVKKPGETSFENTDILNREIVHSGEYVNAVTFVQKIDLDQYRPFIDFKLTIKRMSNHTGPGYKSKGQTFHDWQGISAASITNTTCVIKDKLSHPYCAMAKVGFTSQQFQGMPKRGYHARGLKVKVPSNYVTREENAGVSAYTRNVSTGVVTSTYQDWDGAFRRFPIYTNNPAWVFYDILTNNRYGLGDFLEEQDIDKYMLYRIARYCDELVDDGKGGTEPRFTCNLYFQKQADAYKVIKDIATVFRSMVYYFDGQVSPIMDAPSGPVYNFTKANVIDGAFSYEGTGSKTRINQCVVSWIDPDANYKVSPLLVEDRKNIADTGKIISQNSVAMGAITEGQALRYGRWKLWTAANQREVVSFKSALNSSFILPGDIINIQDADRYSTRYGGRVSNSGTTRSNTSIPLDSSVTLLSGSTYTLSVLFEQPGAFATESVTINSVDYVKGDLIKQAYIDSNGNGTYTLQDIDTEEKAVNAKATSGGTDALVLNWSDTHRIETQTVTPSLIGSTVNTITVESAFTAIPNAESMWVLTETTTGGSEVKGSAKEYKVLSISQDANSEYSFTAVEHYDEKFSAVDEDFTTFIADTVYPAVRSTDVVPPVKDVRSSNRPKLRVSEGGFLSLSWTPPTNVGEVEGRYEHLTGYEIVHNFGTVESPIRILDPNRTNMSFHGLTVGNYKVAVRVINVLNNVSEPVIIKAQVSNKYKDRTIPRLPDEVPNCGTTSVGYTVDGNTFKTKKAVYSIKNPGDESSLVSNTNTTATAWQQDCSNLPNITWSESDRDSQGQFITEHAYILLDASDTTDRFKLLKYYKPTGAGTAHWYDTGTGNTTNRFGSALTGTFTKAADSSKVTGSGTAFTTQIEEGDVLKLGSEEIRVSAVDSNTVLYLERASDTAHSGVTGYIQNIRIDYINDVIVARVYKTSSGLVLAETYSKVDAVIKAVTDIADSVTASQMNVSDLGDIATDMTGVTLTDPVIVGGSGGNFAPLASPALTGIPTAPTASAGTNNTQIATTNYADRAVANLVDSAPSDLNTLNELAAALADDDAFSATVNTSLGNRLRVDTASQGLSSTQKTNALTNLAIENINNTSDANKPVSTAQQTALNLKANLASPTFTGTVAGVTKTMVGLSNVANESKATMFSSAALTGTPTAPTAGSGTNTTQIATTAFVQAATSNFVTSSGVTSVATNNGITGGTITGTGTIGLATNNVTNASVSGSTLTLTRQGASNVTFSDTNTTYTGGTNISLSGTTFNHDDVSAGFASPIGSLTPIGTDGNGDKTVALLSYVSHDDGHITGAQTATLTFSGPVELSAQGQLDITANSIEATHIKAANATFDTLVADMATFTTIDTDVLDANSVIAREIQVFPSGGTAPTISGTTLAGAGIDLKQDGDLYIGNASANKYIFWDQSAGTMTIRGTINASDIDTGTLNASNITVTNLDANSINNMSLTTGSNGQLAIGTSISAGNQSVLLGPSAGGTGLGNTSIGKFAGNGTTGTDNVAIGQDAGMSVTTGKENIMIGSHTGRAAGGVTTNKTGDNNIGIGACSASEAVGSPSTSQTFQALTSGSQNVALGSASATNLTTGNNNLFLGTGAGQNVTTGGGNICIKANAPSATGDTQLAIGGWITGNSSYNVGIGTTAPNHKLDVYSNERFPLRVHRTSSDLSSTQPVGIGFSLRGDTVTSTTDTRAAIMSQYNGDFYISVDSGGNLNTTDPIDETALFIEGSTKYVGIGTTAPNSKLHVGSGTNTNVTVGSQSNPAFQIGGTTNYRLGMYTDGETGYIENRNGDDGIQFKVKTAGDSMRIDGGTGNVGIGTTAPDSPLHISNNGAPADDVTLLTLQNGNGTSDISTPNTFIDFVFKDSNTNVTPQARIAAHAGDGGDANTQILEGKGYLTFHCSNTSNTSGEEDPAEVMRLSPDGSLTATGNITAYSDERLKENIQTLDGKKVLQMRGVSFTKDGQDGSGVIAQELEKIAPELVRDSEYKSVAYGNLTGYLIEAIKEQQSEIDELKDLVKQLLKN